MKAGDLDHRLVPHEPVSTRDAVGGEVVNFLPRGKLFASKRDVSDAERVRAMQEGATITTRFQVRWSSLTASISAGWRVKCDGVLYAVTGVKEIGRRVGREITATALADETGG